MKTLFLIFSILLLSLSGCSSDNSAPENSNHNSNYEAQKKLAENSNNSNTANSTSHASSTSEELYRFATTIYTKTAERQNNVRICCNQLNGQIVSSGETFSFCDTLRSCKTRGGLPKSRNF